MLIFLFLIITELLSIMVLNQYFGAKPKAFRTVVLSMHLLFSIYSWYLIIWISTYKGLPDNPRYVYLNMNFIGIMIAVWIPRSIIILLHYTGKLFSTVKKQHIRSFTNTGIYIGLVLFLVSAGGNFFGRFNYSVTKTEVEIPGLPKDLNGFTIVQISDIHLGSYYNNYDRLGKVVKTVNGIHPDVIFNTGDFVSFGWNEFAGSDTIFRRMKSRYGNFAVLGNHDIGTYIAGYTPSDIEANIIKIKELIQSSGYLVLDDENVTIIIGKTVLAIAGVETRGRYPGIIHGDLEKALSGTDSADYKILLSHDPNHWYESVTGKSDVGFTFSGHTHGMQFGIITPWFKWSPSKYIYPQWNGLFKDGNQYLYVNRGLGIMQIPFRIFMPPEITVVTLISPDPDNAY